MVQIDKQRNSHFSQYCSYRQCPSLVHSSVGTLLSFVQQTVCRANDKFVTTTPPYVLVALGTAFNQESKKVHEFVARLEHERIIKNAQLHASSTESERRRVTNGDEHDMTALGKIQISHRNS